MRTQHDRALAASVAHVARSVAEQYDPPHGNGPGVRTRTMDTPKRKSYVATFEGTGNIPFDMLRFDACWPLTQDSVLKTLARRSDLGPRKPGRADERPRKVAFASNLGFTPQRWASFGWVIVR